jgi:hypothetical protein
MPDLATLNTEGFLFTEIAGEWNVLSADFGDGLGLAKTTGAPQGTRSWSMRIDVLPDGAEAPPIESLGRARYIWQFFRLSKANGNQAFWFETEDPDDGLRKLFLASFVDNRLSYSVLCAKIYSAGLMLRQRRLRNVESPVVVT